MERTARVEAHGGKEGTVTPEDLGVRQSGAESMGKARRDRV